MKKILFIIGSLRKESFNRKLAEEAERMLDGRATVEYLDYSDLPMMNQDIEFPAPDKVSEVRLGSGSYPSFIRILTASAEKMYLIN